MVNRVGNKIWGFGVLCRHEYVIIIAFSEHRRGVCTILFQLDINMYA